MNVKILNLLLMGIVGLGATGCRVEDTTQSFQPQNEPTQESRELRVERAGGAVEDGIGLDDECGNILCSPCPPGEVAVEGDDCCPSCQPADEDSESSGGSDGTSDDECGNILCSPCADNEVAVEGEGCCPSCQPADEDGESSGGSEGVSNDECGNILCSACPPGEVAVEGEGCCPSCQPADEDSESSGGSEGES